MILLKKQKAFTLVELIIVITILAILATIAFVSFQGYVKDSRDSTRLTTLKNIESGLQTFQTTTGNYPEPDNKVNILASGSLIGYQGNVGDNVSKILKINSKPQDPLDKSLYTYSTNISKTKYDLLTMKENQISGVINQTYALDNLQRIPKILGNNIGVILDKANTPIEQYGLSVDIVNTLSGYTVYLGNNSKITGTGGVLRVITSSFNKEGNMSYVQSCKEINDNGLSSGDGVYSINPTLTSTGTFQVYCDMTTQGGGWTLLFNMRGLNSYDKTFVGEMNGDFLDKNGISLAYSRLPLGKNILLEAQEQEIKGKILSSNQGRVDTISNIAVEGNNFLNLANGVSNVLVFNTGTTTTNLLGASLYGGDYAGGGLYARKLCLNDKETIALGFVIGICPHINAAGWPDYTNYSVDYNYHRPKYFRIWTK